MAHNAEKDAVTGVETTGHEWDGIKELNNPLPRWWLWTFYITVLWSIGYWVVYPAWPLVSSYTEGMFGYSSRQEVMDRIAEAKEAQSEYLGKIETASLDEIRGDSELLNFALAGGRSAFAVNCSQCHGQGAQGFVGYPNLNDDAWIWGGKPDEIMTTILYGIRSDHDDTRYSEMPAFGRDGLLERPQINEVVEYVLQISGQDHDSGMATAGKDVFVEQCAACHGENGEGIRETGAPRLTDSIWLYGGDRDTLRATVTNARYGVMPAWTGRLDEATIKQLAVYVHSLGGGE
ncbi:cytochrome-c oxidase, cbb3-type subunit III [Nisaea acidiphila]|uniref:Cbb3-type cytochrome c oxidase subunit n=1 Tax=Nisaea acidiphila TaxID=1862145 RepID=A0A9J7AT14_9PROT|nr:cytochrome-c oxidase, cbb3-type subunit III [Nisaea acidiphila]UUX50318.1 cytochrome-c oxidase, cbb3-type subunit III [Nisaea acidiphila]